MPVGMALRRTAAFSDLDAWGNRLSVPFGTDRQDWGTPGTWRKLYLLQMQQIGKTGALQARGANETHGSHFSIWGTPGARGNPWQPTLLDRWR